MVSRRTKKRKRAISSNSLKQKTEYGTINYSENRLHEHPYRTRSKSLREMETTTDLIESPNPSRRSSDDSIIYLGSFHKSPQLVTLEDSNESFSEKVVQPEAWITQSSNTKSQLNILNCFDTVSFT